MNQSAVVKALVIRAAPQRALGLAHSAVAWAGALRHGLGCSTGIGRSLWPPPPGAQPAEPPPLAQPAAVSTGTLGMHLLAHHSSPWDVC